MARPLQGPGCTDPLACNFDPEATEDNGSCIYPGDPGGCAVMPYNPDSDADELISVADLIAILGYFGQTFNPGQPLINGVPLADYVASIEEIAAIATGDAVLVPSAIEGTVPGQILYWTGSDWALLDPGLPGEVLKMGADDVPYWTSLGSVEEAPTVGCGDPQACNYDAAVDLTFSILCDFSTCYGCTDPEYAEYDDSVLYDDGSCATEAVPGCTDPLYFEFNEAANVDDGSCETLLEDLYGCLDSEACNFDPAVLANDGSCRYEVTFEVTLTTGSDGAAVALHLYDDLGEVVWSAEGLAADATETLTAVVCGVPGCFTLGLQDGAASPTGYSVSLDGTELVSGSELNLVSDQFCAEP